MPNAIAFKAKNSFHSSCSVAGYPRNPFNDVICNDTISASGVFTAKELCRLSRGKYIFFFHFPCARAISWWCQHVNKQTADSAILLLIPLKNWLKMVELIFPQPPSCPDRVACTAVPGPRWQSPAKASMEWNWKANIIATPTLPPQPWIMVSYHLVTVSCVHKYLSIRLSFQK